jgi:uncharacterized protein YbaA (DUF1428 family)
MEKTSAQVWKDHGALEYHICVADDVPVGEITSFPRALKLEEGEIVVYAWIVYSSRADRDRIQESAPNDPRFEDYDFSDMPFDGKRMIFGGFREVYSQ